MSRATASTTESRSVIGRTPRRRRRRQALRGTARALRLDRIPHRAAAEMLLGLERQLPPSTVCWSCALRAVRHPLAKQALGFWAAQLLLRSLSRVLFTNRHGQTPGPRPRVGGDTSWPVSHLVSAAGWPTPAGTRRRTRGGTSSGTSRRRRSAPRGGAERAPRSGRSPRRGGVGLLGRVPQRRHVTKERRAPRRPVNGVHPGLEPNLLAGEPGSGCEEPVAGLDVGTVMAEAIGVPARWGD